MLVLTLTIKKALCPQGTPTSHPKFKYILFTFYHVRCHNTEQILANTVYNMTPHN